MSAGVGIVVETLELEVVVVVEGLLDGTLFVVEEGLEVVVVDEDDVIGGVVDVAGFLVVVGDG